MFAIVLVICGLLVFLARRLTGSWLYPVTLFVVLWTICIAGALICFPNASWCYSGILWILVCLFSTLIGFLTGRGISPKRKTVEEKSVDANASLSKNMKRILVSLIIAGMLYVGVQIQFYGFSLQGFNSVDSFLEMNTEIAIARYSGSIVQTFGMQILVCLVYATSALGGYSYVNASGYREKLLCCSTMLPIGCLMFATNAKAGFIGSLFLWIAGFISHYIYIHKQVPRLSKTQVFIALGLMCLMAFMFYMTFLLRFGSFDPWAITAANNKYSIYAFAHILNFDFWFKNASHANFDGGLNTFMAFFSQLGLVEKKAGVYEVILGGYGNVFSIFRGAIEDFGVVGALAFFGLVGFADGFLYRRLAKSKAVVTAYLSIIFTYLYSIIISPWIYSTYVISLVFFFIIITLFDNSKAKCPGHKELSNFEYS